MAMTSIPRDPVVPSQKVLGPSKPTQQCLQSPSEKVLGSLCCGLLNERQTFDDAARVSLLMHYSLPSPSAELCSFGPTIYCAGFLRETTPAQDTGGRQR